jgi:hypothetical protein
MLNVDETLSSKTKYDERTTDQQTNKRSDVDRYAAMQRNRNEITDGDKSHSATGRKIKTSIPS